MARKISLRLRVLLFLLSLAPVTLAQPTPAPAPNATVKMADEFAASLVAARTEEERAALLQSRKDLPTPALVQALVRQGNRLRTQGGFSPADAPQALSIFQLALRISEQQNDKADAATVLMNLSDFYRTHLSNRGDANTNRRNQNQALEYYRKGLTLREELGDQPGIAGAQLALGFSNSAQGNMAQALEHYEKSLAVREKLGNKAAIAVAQQYVGDANRFLGNHAAALAAYQKASSLREELGDKAPQAAMQNSIGDIHRAQNNYGAAALAYQKGMDLAEAAKNLPLKADLLYKIGYLYQAQHNYGVALVYHQKVLAIQEAAKNTHGMAGALDAICGDHGMQGNTKAALENCHRSLALKESLGNKPGIALTHNLIAWFYHHNGDYKAALEHYQRVLPQAQASENWPVLAKALFDSGEAYERLGDLNRALEHYQKAQEQYASIGVHDESARALWGIGSIQLRQGQTAEALRTAERASELAKQANGYEALWRARTLAGEALLRLDQLPAAQTAFEEAVAAIEQMRNQLAGSEHERIRYLNERLRPWHKLVEILLARGNARAALDYTESAKSRGLLDVMQNGHAVMTESMTEAEKQQEQKVNGALATVNSQILREGRRPKHDQALLAQLRERQQQLRSEREAFYYSLYATHHELRELRGKAQPLKFEEVAQLLPDTFTALLNFLVADDKTYLFVLSKDRQGKVVAKTYTIPIPATALAEQSGKFRQLLAQRSFAFQSSARALHDLLLKPAAAQLAGKRMLIISPDAGLWELPFQALQPAPNRYLIETQAIAYAPSLSAVRETLKLRNDRARANPASRLILAVGNPALERTALTRSKMALMDEAFDPLPEAEEQVLALKQIYGPARSRVLTGAEAREEVFKAEAPNYRILHLATHGVLNDASGIYSHLLMAQDAGGQEDGLLEAWEFIRMKLRADLTILSACETARGKWGAGEGVIGMTSMLFVAGCPTVAVSQWKVEAASTAKLMVEFHRQLQLRMQRPKTTLGAAQSLRLASLKMLRGGQYRHPFWWAGFVVVGDGF